MLRRASIPKTVLVIKIELYRFEVLFWRYYFEMNDGNGGAKVSIIKMKDSIDYIIKNEPVKFTLTVASNLLRFSISSNEVISGIRYVAFVFAL